MECVSRVGSHLHLTSALHTPWVTLMCVGDPHSKLRQVFMAGEGDGGMWP